MTLLVIPDLKPYLASPKIRTYLHSALDSKPRVTAPDGTHVDGNAENLIAVVGLEHTWEDTNADPAFRRWFTHFDAENPVQLRTA